MKVKELIEKLKKFKEDDEIEIGRTHDEELVLVVSRKVEWRNGRSTVIGIIRFREENRNEIIVVNPKEEYK